MPHPSTSASQPEGHGAPPGSFRAQAQEVPVHSAGPRAQARWAGDALGEAIDEVDEGVAVLDGEALLLVNRAFAAMTGYGQADLLAPGFRLQALFAPEAARIMEKGVHAREPAGERHEAFLRAKDGTHVCVEVSVKPVRGEGPLRLVVVRNLSARKRTEAEVERSRKDLAQTEKLAAIGSLVNGVAHEIRTPLVIIQNHAHILASGLARIAPACSPEDQARIRSCVDEIGLGVERINRLVRDLHRFSKMPAAEFEPASLPQTVDEALRLWVATHPGAHVTFDVRHEPQDPLRIDRVKIQQVLLNLLQNAAEAMPGGGRVGIRTGPTPEGARVVVHDEGEGMSEETRGLMFEPLYTTKPDGMGLGLSVARRIVQLHRGRIECESRPGQGTSFTLTLPRT